MASKRRVSKRDWKEKKFDRENWDLRSTYYRSHLANDEVRDEVRNRFNRPVYGMGKKDEVEK